MLTYLNAIRAIMKSKHRSFFLKDGVCVNFLKNVILNYLGTGISEN